ncbi:hypothetical protein, partial [Vibrio harveyi]|uniref:hypothetical protein n=1 Tax=Vibrio harveyi TaxID=669 RepID=UPI0018C25D01
KSMDLRRALVSISPEFQKINAETLAAEYRAIWGGSVEDSMRPMDGAGATLPDPATGQKGTTALDRFSQDL